MSQQEIGISDQRLLELHRESKIKGLEGSVLSLLITPILDRLPHPMLNKLGLGKSYIDRLITIGEELSRSMYFNRFERIFFENSFAERISSNDISKSLEGNAFATREDKEDLLEDSQVGLAMSNNFASTVKHDLLSFDRSVSPEQFDQWVKFARNSGLILGSLFSGAELHLVFLRVIMINTATRIKDLRVHSPVLDGFIDESDKKK